MLKIGTKEQIQAYRESPAINQSTLKNLQFGLASFLKKQDEEGPTASFERGSAVDCILTAPEGAFEEQFYISTLEKKPSETEMLIVSMVFDKIPKEYGIQIEPFPYYDAFIQESIETVGWQSNWKMETRVEKIRSNTACQEYFDDLKNSQDKTILSLAQYGEVMAVVESLRNNERTREFFDREKIQKSENEIWLYQVPIYFEYEGHQCKALPDIVRIKMKEDEVEQVQVIDLKTMSEDTLKFPESVSKYRYEIQAAWYVEALDRVDKSFWKELGVELTRDSQMLPFLFVVESMYSPGRPLIYEVLPSLMEQGRSGSEDSYDCEGNTLLRKGKKGFTTLLEEYAYYQNNDFSEDILLKNKNGWVKIDVNGIR